jgi:hypothetical protein
MCKYANVQMCKCFVAEALAQAPEAWAKEGDNESQISPHSQLGHHIDEM